MSYNHWVGQFIASAINTLPDQKCPTTPAPLPDHPCHQVTLVALTTNTGDQSPGNPWVRVGDSSISANQGTPLVPGTPILIYCNNLKLIYLFGNGSDIVSVAYV